MTNDLIKNAPLKAMKNKGLLIESKICACFHCRGIMAVKDIVEWTDYGETAICPQCGNDCVIPTDESVDLSVLNSINRYWFPPAEKL